jgi:hypothetical protein
MGATYSPLPVQISKSEKVRTSHRVSTASEIHARPDTQAHHSRECASDLICRVTIDPTSNQQSEQLPVYHACSIDGEATAPLVYVNYGIPADYEQLARMGISVKPRYFIAVRRSSSERQ